LNTSFLPLGQLLGIPLRMHTTVLWLALFLGLYDGLPMVIGLAILLCIVMLHELGHSIVAQWHGVKVINITLYPFGGLAQMSVVPEKPTQELQIALAGPGMNFLLAVPGAVLLTFMGYPLFEAPTGPDASPILALVWLWVTFNTTIGVFNLLPAFPLDGGRVLRSLLVQKFGYLQATELAVRVGRYLAFAMLMFGVVRGPFLPFTFIAGFIWVMGGRELIMVRLRHVSQGANPFERMFQFGGKMGGQPGGGFPFGDQGGQAGFPGGLDREPLDVDFEDTQGQAKKPSIQIGGAPSGTDSGFSEEEIERLERHHGRMKRPDE
jgi:Zn-dependent protease